MEILDEFGVKPILLAAQVVNFLLLLFILKRFLYRPLLKVLDERKQKIVAGLRNAEEIEKRLEEITVEKEKRLKEAGLEAEKVLQEAAKVSDKIVAEARVRAEKDIEKMMEKSQKYLDLEKEKFNQQMRVEVAGLVVASLEKVIGKVVTAKEQKKLVEDSIKASL